MAAAVPLKMTSSSCAGTFTYENAKEYISSFPQNIREIFFKKMDECNRFQTYLIAKERSEELSLGGRKIKTIFILSTPKDPEAWPPEPDESSPLYIKKIEEAIERLQAPRAP